MKRITALLHAHRTGEFGLDRCVGGRVGDSDSARRAGRLNLYQQTVTVRRGSRSKSSRWDTNWSFPLESNGRRRQSGRSSFRLHPGGRR